MTEPSEVFNPLYVALTGLAVASLSALAPMVTLFLTSRIRSREKREDWARQDAVARQAAEAASLLLSAQERTSRQASEAAKLLLAAQAETTLQNTETQGKLNQIHTLVNSNLTKEMQDRLVALKGQAVLMREVIRLNNLNKLAPAPDAKVALENLEGVVKTLEMSLVERTSATIQADTAKEERERERVSSAV